VERLQARLTRIITIMDSRSFLVVADKKTSKKILFAYLDIGLLSAKISLRDLSMSWLRVQLPRGVFGLFGVVAVVVVLKRLL